MIIVYFYEMVLKEDVVCFCERNLGDVMYYGLGGF